ncbi:MAG: CYTH domain-containing protein [Cyanobacterium sp. T60_A2020_053]|nr:CYTH domain-containing protein [Cyanobacterium sp. T60_A2020_053]
MGTEIERKFLINRELWRPPPQGLKYLQGYIYTKNNTTVRVRVVGMQGFLTLKTKTVGYSRSEYEYLIPVEDAEAMLNTMCDQPLIEKIRYKLNYQGFLWEVDEFLGDNQGLILAEIELQEEGQFFEIPPWIGKEVTADSRYYNSYLARNPFQSW